MGMHKLGRYAYSMIDGCVANNTFLVWMKLREGYDPNGNYVGITAMQVAVENANEEMFLLLLKFNGDPNKKTASRSRGALYASGETPRQMLERLISETEKEPEKCTVYTRMKSWIDDTTMREKAAEAMMPKLKQMEEDERNAGLSLAGQLLSVVGLIVITITLVHVLIIMLPDVAHQVMPDQMVSHLCLFSPVFMGSSLLKPFPNPSPGTYGYCIVEENGHITPLIKEAAKITKTEL